MPICYINTDLDITGPKNLTSIAAYFEAAGLVLLNVSCDGADGQWYARFEAGGPGEEPEPNITAMLAVIESINEPELDTWRSCTFREFNIGYECGREPWAFNQGLSSDTVRRMAAVETSLRITLYPAELKRHPSP